MPQLTESEIERRIDVAVQARLATDSDYLNAESADAQAEREQAITDEEEGRVLAQHDDFLPTMPPGHGRASEYGGGVI